MKAAKWGTGFDFRLRYNMLHIVAHAVVCSSGGWGVGGINVPDEYFTYVTEHVAVVKCCQHVAHAVVYLSGGGGVS